MEREYESMVIVQPELAEQAQEEVFQKVIKKIEAIGGKTLSSKVWSKERNFCFPLKSSGAEKKKFGKGCYWLLNFILDTEKLMDLKETMRLEERILRNIILRRQDKEDDTKKID